MSCKTETKYLTVKFIYGSRILNIRQGLIVCSSDKINSLYNDIAEKLLVNHVDKDSDKFFYLFCNSKLCNSKLDKTFKEIFGLSPYVINVILKREFFNKDNLIRKNVISSSKARAKKRIKSVLSKNKIQEVSSYDFIEDLERNASIDFKKDVNYRLFKLFLKMHLREDIILIELLTKFIESDFSNELDIESNFGDLLSLINDELNSKQLVKRPIIMYYQSLFSVEQLKSILPEEDKYIINEYLTGIEEFGIETLHPGCLADQELRNILIDPLSAEQFMDFIDKEGFNDLLNSLDVFKKYFFQKKTKPVQKLTPNKKANFTELMKTPISVQTGGNLERFNNLTRILEINGEPRHDFGKGERAEHLPDTIDKNFLGKDTNEGSEFNRLKININHDLGIGRDTELFLGNHESKYFLHFYKNTNYHIDSDIKNINSRYRFFRFKSGDRLDMNVYNDDVSGISHDIFNSNSLTGINFLKSIMIEDNVKHFLFDTSASIEGTTCFKECLLGNFFDCERAGKTLRDKQNSSKLCNISGKDNITEIVPIVKFWDPASSDPKKFIKKIKQLHEASDNEYLKMMTTLFMNNSDTETEFTLRDSSDNTWTPKRNDLSDVYQVKINPQVIKDIKSGKEPTGNMLILKLKNIEDDIFIEEGLSVYKLSVMINLLMDKTMTTARLNSLLKGKKDVFRLKTKDNYDEFVDIIFYFYNSIKNRSITRTEVLKILIDMKKSGDWSLIKWTQINNKYFADTHKTVLYTGDILCGLFSIANGVSTLFGTTSIENNNPFYFTDSLGDIQFIQNRTLAYYSGSDKVFSYGDFTQKCEYIADNLFDIGSERNEEGAPYDVADLTDEETYWDKTDLDQIKLRLPNVISELEKTPESLNLLLSGRDSILGRLQIPIIRYEKMSPESRETSSDEVVLALNNFSIIVNIFNKLEKISSHNYFEKAHELTDKVFNLLVDFTTTYTYIGMDKYKKDPSKIFIPSEVQEELKYKLRNLTGNTSKPSSFETVHPSSVSGSSTRNTAFDLFKKYREEINDNLLEILRYYGTDSIDGVCSNILRIWGGTSEPTSVKVRMGHFIRDISVILKSLIKVRSFLDIFDIFPNMLRQINEDIELIKLEDSSNTTNLKMLLNQLKINIVSKALGRNEDANEILTYVSMIKRIYECFSELLDNIADIDKGHQIADLSEISRQDQQESFINACESIDSLNSNLQLYFGYIDIRT